MRIKALVLGLNSSIDSNGLAKMQGPMKFAEIIEKVFEKYWMRWIWRVDRKVSNELKLKDVRRTLENWNPRLNGHCWFEEVRNSKKKPTTLTEHVFDICRHYRVDHKSKFFRSCLVLGGAAIIFPKSGRNQK